MIVLDAKVVSGAMKPEPNPAVRAWLNDQVAATMYLSGVALAALWFGIGALAAGKRKDMLTQVLATSFPSPSRPQKRWSDPFFPSSSGNHVLKPLP